MSDYWMATWLATTSGPICPSTSRNTAFVVFFIIITSQETTTTMASTYFAQKHKTQAKLQQAMAVYHLAVFRVHTSSTSMVDRANSGDWPPTWGAIAPLTAAKGAAIGPGID
jgi:hypothetical protein